MVRKARAITTFLLSVTLPAATAALQGGLTRGPGGTIWSHLPSFLRPANAAWAIWIPLVLLSIGFGIYQTLLTRRESRLVRAIEWWPASAFAATFGWTLSQWSSEHFVSVVMAVWLVVSLAMILRRTIHHDAMLSRAESWLIFGTFSVLLGWATTTLLGDVGRILVALGLEPAGARAETVGVALVAMTAVVAALVAFLSRGNFPYAMTVAWGFACLAMEQLSGRPGTSAAIGGFAILAAAIVLIGPLVSRLPSLRPPLPQPVRTQLLSGA